MSQTPFSAPIRIRSARPNRTPWALSASALVLAVAAGAGSSAPPAPVRQPAAQAPPAKAAAPAATVRVALNAEPQPVAPRAAPSVAEHAAPAQAQTVISGGVLSVDIDKATMIVSTEAARTVFVANPEIADVQVNDPKRVVVFGRRGGTTTVYVTGVSGRVSAYTVNVGRAVSELAPALRAAAPGGGVHVSSTPDGLTVTGNVATPREAGAVKATAQQYLGDKETLNLNAGVVGETQVNLQVRIVEVSRSVNRTFGFNWNSITSGASGGFTFGIGREILESRGAYGRFVRDPDVTDSIGFRYRSKGGSTDINGVIDALQREGMISILAQPNLTAASGQVASFLAGGEFPVPVAQTRDAITVEWKKFGVALDFTPTVLDPGRLSIKVRPEVSEISDRGAVTINDIRIPGITVRRAETTVELASGQSFAIAGLFQNNMSSTVRQYPWLGEVPVLGTLFRSKSFIQDQTELVIIVTPYIVRPAQRTADLATPADGVVYANELEQVLYGKVAAKPAAAPAGDRPRLSGPAGFQLEDKR